MPITPIFLVLAAIIGLLIGLLVSSLFSSREPHSTAVDTPPVPNDMEKEGFSKGVSLWYSPAGPKVVLEQDGAFYRNFLELTAEQKSRVHKLLGLWSDWTETMTSDKYEPVVIARQAEPVVAERELLEPEPVLNWSVAEAIKEEKGAVANPSGIEKPNTIAGQISLIIDDMLEGHPLKEKGIKLIENSHQGVDVWIGTEKFDGIDAIPYPEVQQLIREAVAQWEKGAA